MSSDLNTNRNTWIAGSIVAIVVFTVVFFSSARFIRGRAGEPRVGSRSPIAELAYCGPEDQEVCIISFSQVVDGDMQVNLQVPHPYYPEFILIIDRYGVESAYDCQREAGLTTAVTCKGPSQAPGEILQFKLISKTRGLLLAEGKFSIIGIALSTPGNIPTTTLEGAVTGTPTGTPTATLAPRTPTVTPTPTSLTPSYPNPSYP